jgi:biopolymer transport protein ExbD
MDATGATSTHFHAGKYTGKMRARNTVAGGLMLASMLDILMAILFFLLKNYSSVVSDFAVGKDISLPRSSALIPPTSALQLVVTQTAILLDEKPIATITHGEIDRKDLGHDGTLIIPLARELSKQKDRSLYFAKHNDQHSFTGTIVLQADKDLKFSLLKKIIYTVGINDFVNMKLAVLKKEG